MKRFTLILYLFLFLNITLFVYAQGTREATNFTLDDLDNHKVTLKDFKGKPLILFFWTTWCPYCRRAMAQLSKTYLEIKANNIELLAINIEESEEKIKRFLRPYTIEFKVLQDSDASVAYIYDIIGIPTYILIDREFNIIFEDNYFPREYKDLLLQNKK
jgi:peroxiredoxin